MDTSNADRMPSMNALANGPLIPSPTPRKIWKARSRGIAMEAKKMATAKLQTIPKLDIVLNNPALIP